LSNPPLVQSLIGKAQLGFYLKCIKSLLVHSKEKIVILLHTDGNISKKDKDCILSLLPDGQVRFSDYKTNYDNTLDALVGRPNCQKFVKNLFGELNSLILYSRIRMTQLVFT
jgi:hypothetical protein